MAETSQDNADGFDNGFEPPPNRRSVSGSPVPNSHQYELVWARIALANAAIAVACALCGWIGLRAGVIGDNIAVIGPAIGLAAAILIVCGHIAWPGIFAGAVAVECTLWPPWVALGIACGNTLAPVLIAWGLRRLHFRADFSRRRDSLMFLVFAGLGLFVSSINGPLWLAIHGAIPWAKVPLSIGLRWLADATGVLVFTPAFVSLLRVRWRAFDSRHLIVSFAVLALNSGAALATFFRVHVDKTDNPPIELLQLMILFLTAVAFRGWVVSVSVSLVTSLAIAGTSLGLGVFAGYPPEDTAALLWAFFAAIGISAWLISALIGEQQSSTAELARSERDYRMLVEDNPANIIRFRADGRLTFGNETFCRFYAIEPDNVPMKSIYELIRGPKAEVIRRELRAILAGPGPYTLLAPFGDYRGVEHWMEWKARRLDGGEFHAVGLDVTERQSAEKERRRLEKVRQENQKQENLGLIAGGLSHDYNNLLTSILGHAEIARELSVDHSAAQTHLDRIIESARRLAETNRQLLAFAGEGRIFEERVDLNTAVRTAAEQVAEAIPPNCEWGLELDERPTAVIGDAPQISLAIRNVLLNAVQSRADGRGNRITVRTQNQEFGPSDFRDALSGRAAPPQSILMTVFDTGSGIDDATLAKIFDPFFSTRALGRGLGLSAVHRIVAEHGGALRIDSESDRGTTVRIAWPAAPELETVPEIATGTASKNDHRRSALIIDDEESVRMLLAQMIGQLGWEALSVENGHRGIAAFRGNVDRIAFVVLDMMMPEMDGLAVQAALRATRPDLPILFCTGYSREMLSTDTPSGPSGVLLKPFRLHELRTAIEGLLRDKADSH